MRMRRGRLEGGLGGPWDPWGGMGWHQRRPLPRCCGRAKWEEEWRPRPKTAGAGAAKVLCIFSEYLCTQPAVALYMGVSAPDLHRIGTSKLT